MKYKEMIYVLIAMILVNWFMFKMISMYESVVDPRGIVWMMGIYTGMVVTKIASELYWAMEDDD